MALLILSAGCSPAKKLVKLSADDVQDLVSAQSFKFIANRMNPMRGPQKNLNSYYDVTISKDTLNSYLPYYGRAHNAGFLPSDYGLRFTSQKFTYTYKEGKNKSLEVTVVPQDVTQIQSLNFTIFDNGSATLDVTSTNKDPISFYGILQPLE